MLFRSRLDGRGRVREGSRESSGVERVCRDKTRRSRTFETKHRAGSPRLPDHRRPGPQVPISLELMNEMSQFERRSPLPFPWPQSPLHAHKSSQERTLVHPPLDRRNLASQTLVSIADSLCRSDVLSFLLFNLLPRWPFRLYPS